MPEAFCAMTVEKKQKTIHIRNENNKNNKFLFLKRLCYNEDANGTDE